MRHAFTVDKPKMLEKLHHEVIAANAGKTWGKLNAAMIEICRFILLS
jgi:hypothetical protein